MLEQEQEQELEQEQERERVLVLEQEQERELEQELEQEHNKMKFPKIAVDRLNKNSAFWLERQAFEGEPPKFVEEIDPKDLEDLVTYAEVANARIKELEEQCGALVFKLRCVAQALK